MRQNIFIWLMAALLALVASDALAQKMPERGLVRKGNRQFNKERYEQSVMSYQEALLHDSTSFEARYNLGNAMIRAAQQYATAAQQMMGQGAESSEGEVAPQGGDPAQSGGAAHHNQPSQPAMAQPSEQAQSYMKMGQELVSRAEQQLAIAAADSTRMDEERAEAYYNLGNSQFSQQKLQEALKSYRQSLKLRPDDMEAKYNYAYTKKLLEQQQNQQQDQQQNQDNQDQNQDQQQNQQDQQQNKDNEQNQDNKDNDKPQDQQGNPEQDKGDNKPDEKEQPQQEGQQPQRSGMSEQQQQQLLDAIQAQEDKTQEKVDEKKKGILIRGRKNW